MYSQPNYEQNNMVIPLNSEQQNTRQTIPFSIMKLVSLIAWLLLLVSSLVSFVKPEFHDGFYNVPINTAYKIFWFSFGVKIDGDTDYLPAMVYSGFFDFCFYSLQ